MQYNYDFHIHHLVQMLEDFERFYYNRNVVSGSWYGKPNFLPAYHLIWFIDSQISGKRFLIVLKSIYERKRKFLFLYPHYEKISRLMSSKVSVVKCLQYIIT